ncbi:MAG: stage III sporulation protein AE [Firmicutes bacterium]|nr:stage III sporulation protein AE [Bacillota bacterium]
MARFWTFLLLFVLAGPPAAPVAQIVEAQSKALDTRELESFLAGLDAEIRPYLPDFRATIKGKAGFDLPGLLRSLLFRFGREIALNGHLLAELVFLAALCAFLGHLGSSFAGESLAQLAFYLCYLVLVGLAANSFVATLMLGRTAVKNLVDFVYALLPVISSLLLASGASATGALFHPLILTGAATVGHLAQTVLFPLAMLTAAVTLVGHLAEGFSLSRLAGFLREATVGITGTGLAVFVGLLAVRGVAAAAADGVALRTAKYVSGTFVPLVGKGMAEAMETVAGCTLIVKNALGGFGAGAILVLSAFPLVKILAVVVIYRLAAALVQPLGPDRLGEGLQAIGNNLLVVFAVTSLVALAFFLALVVLVAMGNLVYALR